MGTQLSTHIHIYYDKRTKAVGYRCIEVSLQWRHKGHDSVSNHRRFDCLLNRLFRRKSKKTSKLRVTGVFAGNSPVTGEFPTQKASNAENVSIWWRHHAKVTFYCIQQKKNIGHTVTHCTHTRKTHSSQASYGVSFVITSGKWPRHIAGAMYMKYIWLYWAAIPRIIIIIWYNFYYLNDDLWT